MTRPEDPEDSGAYYESDLFDSDGMPVVWRYCCPIVIASFSFGVFLEKEEHILVRSKSDLPKLRSGTLTFVQFDGQVYGLTCKHVVQALADAIAKDREHFDGKGFPYPEDVWRRFFFMREDIHYDINLLFENHPNAEIDMAGAWIPPELFDAIGRIAFDINASKDGPSVMPDNTGGLAVGYPESNRRIYARERDDDTLALASVTFRTRLQRSAKKCLMAGALPEKLPLEVDVLSGMSGGPMVASTPDWWGLVGIITDGGDVMAYTKGIGYYNSPSVNIMGEHLDMPQVRAWLSAMKGKIPERRSVHIRARTSGTVTLFESIVT